MKGYEALSFSRCDNGIMRLKFSKAAPDAPTVKYEEPNDTFATSLPRVMDAFDRRYELKDASSL